MKKNIRILGVLALTLGLSGIIYYEYHHPVCTVKQPTITVPTFYGDIAIHEPVLIELINHPAMQRLKKIRQYGVCHYFSDRAYGEYNRYQHSLGVFALLRMYGADEREQIAGLLHDVSHTVFSHVGDWIFKHHSHLSSYQDDVHAWYLQQSGLGSVLNKYGYTIESVLHKKGDFKALEQDLPDICADRLEYNLQGAVLEKLINPEDVHAILASVSFEDGKWVFNDPLRAKQLARVSIYLSYRRWGSPDNSISYYWAAQALRRMVEIGELTLDDIHFGTDDDIWEKMRASNDPLVAATPQNIINYRRYYFACDPQYANFSFTEKFRGINPLVKTEHGLRRLTELDNQFRLEYEHIKKMMAHGWHLCVQTPDKLGFA